MRQKLDAATCRRLAVRGSVSPESIQRVWLGVAVRGLAGYRARAALLEAGYEPAEPQSQRGLRVVRGGKPPPPDTDRAGNAVSTPIPTGLDANRNESDGGGAT